MERDPREFQSSSVGIWICAGFSLWSGEDWKNRSNTRLLAPRVGFEGLEFGPQIDTYAEASGERSVRKFGVFGHSFTASKPQ